MQAGKRRIGRRALFAILITWLPMLLLAAAQGVALGPTRLESFLMDFAANVRFLVAVPVFLSGEAICRAQLRTVVHQFLNAGLVREESRARFVSMVQNTVRLSQSGWTDVVLAGLAYLHSAVTLAVFLAEVQDPTWRLQTANGHSSISLAGGWLTLVAFPLFSFLVWRWLWRIALWWRFVWQTARLDLQPSPSHRDGAGGLAFLGNSVEAFAPFVFGTSAIAAAIVADFVVYEGHSPLQYQWHVLSFVAALLILIAGPLLFFIRPLYKAKEEAIFQYGALASHQIQRIEKKWLPERSTQPASSSAEGTHAAALVRENIESSMPDFRSVTHLGHSVTAVHKMSLVPLGKEDILKPVVIALLPFIPVLATQIPMEEILAVLLKILG